MQRVPDEMELVGREVLAAVGGDGERGALRVDGEEVQVREARRHTTLRFRKQFVLFKFLHYHWNTLFVSAYMKCRANMTGNNNQ